jgi:hypothetical protein
MRMPPFGEMPSLLERADWPLPRGMMPAGTGPLLAVAGTPAHPSDVVHVHMRRDGGPAQVIRAMPEATPWQEGSQWFRAALPVLDPGRRLDYRVELSRAGRPLATLPADGSWLTVTGDAPAPPRPTGQVSSQVGESPSSAGAPRWAYELSFFAALTLNLRPEIIGATPEGYRIDFFVESGQVLGPRFNATVRRREGGDWMCIRRDGIGVLDVRLTFETSDGALILDRAGGVFDLGPDGYARVAAGQLSGSPPVYVDSTWSTAHPAWQWLNRCQGFGIGRVVLETLQVQCDVYIPQVLDRLRDD